MRTAAILLVASLLLAGCAGSERASSSWTGLGARLADWETAHPPGHGSGIDGGCTSEGCYGRQLVLGRETTHEFTSVVKTTSGERIFGYEQALPEGTPLATAKARVLSLLPPDTRTQEYWRFHAVERSYDRAGDSCAIWNLHSDTLGRLLAGTGPTADTSGEISVILSTNDAYDLPRLEAKNVTNAIVTARSLPRHAGC